MFFYDPFYMIVMVIGGIMVFLPQLWVKNTYTKYSEQPTERGVSGAEVAMAILRDNRVNDVTVEPTHGFLSDHYDPTSKMQALKLMRESADRGEFATGILYIEPAKPDFTTLLNLVDEPLDPRRNLGVRKCHRQVMEVVLEPGLDQLVPFPVGLQRPRRRLVVRGERRRAVPGVDGDLVLWEQPLAEELAIRLLARRRRKRLVARRRSIALQNAQRHRPLRRRGEGAVRPGWPADLAIQVAMTRGHRCGPACGAGPGERRRAGRGGSP